MSAGWLSSPTLTSRGYILVAGALLGILVDNAAYCDTLTSEKASAYFRQETPDQPTEKALRLGTITAICWYCENRALSTINGT